MSILSHKITHTVPPSINPFSFGDEPNNIDDSVGIQCVVTKGDAQYQ